MNTDIFAPLEVWFVVGSQHLYGPETLAQVAANSAVIAEALNASGKLPVKVVLQPTVKTPDEIYTKLAAHIQRHAPGVELVRQGSMAPSKTPLDSPFAQPLLEAITAAQGAPPLLVPSMGGSLPDYVFTKILGVPAFVIPYANADEANHAPNENLEVERFYAGIKTGAAILTRLGAMAQG